MAISILTATPIAPGELTTLTLSGAGTTAGTIQLNGVDHKPLITPEIISWVDTEIVVRMPAAFNLKYDSSLGYGWTVTHASDTTKDTSGGTSASYSKYLPPAGMSEIDLWEPVNAEGYLAYYSADPTKVVSGVQAVIDTHTTAGLPITLYTDGEFQIDFTSVNGVESEQTFNFFFVDIDGVAGAQATITYQPGDTVTQTPTEGTTVTPYSGVVYTGGMRLSSAIENVIHNSGVVSEWVYSNDANLNAVPNGSAPTYLNGNVTFDRAQGQSLITHNNINVVNEVQHYLPAGAQGGNPSGGFTNTGLDRLGNGNWLVGNDGRTDEADPTNLASLVILSSDFKTIVQEIDVSGADLANGGSCQGVAVATDGTYWFASPGNSKIFHVDTNGVKLGEIDRTGTKVGGIAYDSENEALWIMNHNSGGISLISAADGTTVLATVNATGAIDMIGYDESSKVLYGSVGGNNAPARIFFYDTVINQLIAAIDPVTSVEAPEGVYIENIESNAADIFFCSDAGFHTTASPGRSLIATMQASTYLNLKRHDIMGVHFRGKLLGNAPSNREVIISQGDPSPSTGYGFAVYVMAANTLRIQHRSWSTKDIYFYDFPITRNVEMRWDLLVDKTANTVSLKVDGADVQPSATHQTPSVVSEGFNTGLFTIGKAQSGTAYYASMEVQNLDITNTQEDYDAILLEDRAPIPPVTSLDLTSDYVEGEGQATLTATPTGTPTSAITFEKKSGTRWNLLGIDSTAPYTKTVNVTGSNGDVLEYRASVDGVTSPTLQITVTGLDEVAPTPVFNGPTTEQAGPHTVELRFSEPVTTFSLSQVAVTNATVSSLVDNGNGSYSYTATPAPNASGNITHSYSAGQVQDAAGNLNVEATPLSVPFNTLVPVEEDTTPNQFSFTDVIDATPGASYESVVTITGVTEGASITVVGGQISNNNGVSWTTRPAPYSEGQTLLKATLRASNLYSTVTEKTVTANGVSDTFSVLTEEAPVVVPSDSTPNQFIFSDRTSVPVNTLYEDIRTITGVSAGETLTVEGGQLSNDGKASWTTLPVVFVPGLTFVKVSLKSSSDSKETVSKKVTVNGVSDEFSLTTREEFKSDDRPKVKEFEVPEIETFEMDEENVIEIDVEGPEEGEPLDVDGGEVSNDGGLTWTTEKIPYVSGMTKARAVIKSSPVADSVESTILSVNGVGSIVSVRTKAPAQGQGRTIAEERNLPFSPNKININFDI